MRVELGPDLAGGVVTKPPSAPPLALAPRRRERWLELALLVAFAAISLWVLALDLWQVLAHGRIWTGTDGLYLVDQMQYLAWIRESSHHLLASNLFVLRSTPADYFQPAIVISGALSALGVAPWLSLLLWKPVAVLGAFYAIRAYVRGTVRGSGARLVALALGLFFGSFTVVYGSLGVVGDLVPSVLSWGYTFGLIALAAMVAALLCYGRDRPWLAALLGALAAALHPWQGELLIVIVLAAELTMWRVRGSRPKPAPAAILVACTALPLAYYAILGRLDPSWTMAREASKHSFSIWSVALALAPLAPLAALGYRERPKHFIEAATRCWPLAALAIFVLSGTALSATPLHAFEGITIPLAVLAVTGARRGLPRAARLRAGRSLPRTARAQARASVRAQAALHTLLTVSTTGAGAGLAHDGPNGNGSVNGAAHAPRSGNGAGRGPIRIGSSRRRRHVLVVLAVLLATVPASVYELASSAKLVAPSTGNANFITADERRALQYLQHQREPGGVLTRFYLGAIVPAETGRRTFVGDCLWSQPNCTPRAKLAEALFSGTLAPQAERAIVSLIGARFVLADCQQAPTLSKALAPIAVGVRRFGCATVYELDVSRSPVDGPLAESGGHAAVRAPRRQ